MVVVVAVVMLSLLLVVQACTVPSTLVNRELPLLKVREFPDHCLPVERLPLPVGGPLELLLQLNGRRPRLAELAVCWEAGAVGRLDLRELLMVLIIFVGGLLPAATVILVGEAAIV